ncbi:hypothetical protein LOK49_LG01G03129 [Camellia lanceoleosa]|uniref:Uncharacterized protein n=1 Tax=Camellia lanceoleosa TaxID=1840588 RepID=A0ACC0IUG4_9ERIC|nr:hypothetical protein LOK49_LG01G03129 [Camellia lanceoleosa]
MSHRRFHSLGNVPFSWEDSPGVSKVTLQDYPTDARLNALNLPPSPEFRKDRIITPALDIKIPLPPCLVQQQPNRSSSRRGLRPQEDPFLAALKECTKTVGSVRAGVESTSNNSLGFKVRKSKFMTFSCKRSCDVKEDNFVGFSNLPPLPRDRSHAGSVKIRE